MDTLPPEMACEAEDARTIGRRSARSQRIEVVTRAERRRSWTAAQKREIVGESLGPELTPTEVARKHGISTGLLYAWRRQLVSVAGAVVARSAQRFTAVELADPPPARETVPAEQSARTALPPLTRLEGLIEIQLPGGATVRVDAQVDARALRCVLRALEGR
jgi:transposase